MTHRVLVVDDDPGILRTLRINLRARGLEVECVGTGTDALDSLTAAPPDLLILDLGLPDMDGISLLRHLRLQSRIPVIVLSARHESDDKVEALDEGADDFVTKPFGMDELMARVRAALRRGSLPEEATQPFVTSHFSLDFEAHACVVADRPVHLTPTEWRLLAELARHEGRVVTREALLKSAWGPTYGREANYLRVYANQLRRKLEPDPSRPVHLLTEPGVGYRLVGGEA